MGRAGKERSTTYGVCTSTQRPYQGQDKSSIEPDKAADALFFACRYSGSPVIPAGKETPWFQCVSDPYGNCHAAIFLYGNV